jgi:Cysteine dioxygenase type I.
MSVSEMEVIHSDLKAKKPVVVTLSDLVSQLHSVFAEDSVNVEQVYQLMSGYKSNPAEWRKYAKFDRFRYSIIVLRDI